MRHRPVKPFFLIIADRDAGVFTVEGPMTDDAEWVVAVCDAQQAGRRVNCSTARPDRAAATAAFAQAFGWLRPDRLSIFSYREGLNETRYGFDPSFAFQAR